MTGRPLEAESGIKPNQLLARFFAETRRLAQLARDREDARIAREIEASGGVGVTVAPWRYRSTREQYLERGLDPYVTPEPGRLPQSGPVVDTAGSDTTQ